jgi:3-deoxy-7-phosphoheptulonate synthase
VIIQMRADAAPADVAYVVARVRSLGVQTSVAPGDAGTAVNLIGDVGGINPGALEGLRGVERVHVTQVSYPLAERSFRRSQTVVTVDGRPIGEDRDVVFIAGPCSVEDRGQVLAAARAVRDAGATFLRGGAFKPRSSPYAFQGLAEEGLRLLAEAREATGLPVVTEVMAVEQIPVVERYADVLQIGTRNMQNFNLLAAVGRSRKPVLLKRGLMSTIEELLLSAEYVLASGNPNVVLCERGIRTFETATRNTLDINAVPVLRGLTHLPVIVDPSHATGRRAYVTPVSRAAVAAGADGLIIEVHPDPDRALSDGQQSLTPEGFAVLVEECTQVARAVGRDVASEAPRSGPARVTEVVR